MQFVRVHEDLSNVASSFKLNRFRLLLIETKTNGRLESVRKRRSFRGNDAVATQFERSGERSLTGQAARTAERHRCSSVGGDRKLQERNP